MTVFLWLGEVWPYVSERIRAETDLQTQTSVKTALVSKFIFDWVGPEGEMREKVKRMHMIGREYVEGQARVAGWDVRSWCATPNATPEGGRSRVEST